MEFILKKKFELFFSQSFYYRDDDVAPARVNFPLVKKCSTLYVAQIIYGIQK
jgi:hypothetical protein